jgi:hypothetical protein
MNKTYYRVRVKLQSDSCFPEGVWINIFGDMHTEKEAINFAEKELEKNGCSEALVIEINEKIATAVTKQTALSRDELCLLLKNMPTLVTKDFYTGYNRYFVLVSRSRVDDTSHDIYEMKCQNSGEILSFTSENAAIVNNKLKVIIDENSEYFSVVDSVSLKMALELQKKHGLMQP